MADKISDNLIEEILSDIKERNGEEIPEQEYSLTDIDLLLAEISGEKKAEKENANEIIFPASEKKEEKPVKKGFFSFDISKIQAFDEDDEDESEVVVEEAPESDRAEETAEEISVSVEDDGQLGFDTQSIDHILDEYKDEPVEDEAESVTGQISIEKTKKRNVQ